MPSVKTEAVRAKAEQKKAEWIYWKARHRRWYVILAVLSGATAAFVAANSKFDIIDKSYAWMPAVLATVFTTLISVLGLQTQANSFESGERALEQALAKYDADPDFGDKQLGDAEVAAIGALKLP